MAKVWKGGLEIKKNEERRVVPATRERGENPYSAKVSLRKGIRYTRSMYMTPDDGTGQERKKEKIIIIAHFTFWDRSGHMVNRNRHREQTFASNGKARRFV